MMRFSTHWAESMGFFKEKYGLFQRKVFGQDDGPFNTLKFQSLFLILVFPIFLLVLEQRFISSLLVELPERRKWGGSEISCLRQKKPTNHKITYNQDYL